MKSSEKMREVATIMEIRADVIERLESIIESERLVLNPDTCEYEPCDPHDESKLTEYSRLKIRTYSEIIDTISKMK